VGSWLRSDQITRMHETSTEGILDEFLQKSVAFQGIRLLGVAQFTTMYET